VETIVIGKLCLDEMNSFENQTNKTQDFFSQKVFFKLWSSLWPKTIQKRNKQGYER